MPRCNAAECLRSFVNTAFLPLYDGAKDGAESHCQVEKPGLNNAVIANSLGCKWDSVQRIVSRCENVWGSIHGVPEDLSNEEIADILFSSGKSVDLAYLQPDSEKILEKQCKGYLRNEFWAEYCSKATSRGKKAYKLSRFNEIVSDYRGWAVLFV